MKTIYITVSAVVSLFTFMTTPTIAESPRPTIYMVEAKIINDLDRRQEKWIDALAWCESQATPTAINPVDSDGTPSYGEYQFKPGTFTAFSLRYGMPTTTDLMDPKQQRAIVKRMINDPSVKIGSQFPDCVHNKVGYPPIKGQK